MSDLTWHDLVMPAQAGWRLRRALLTTYDQPDDTFLVEELLPALLGLTARATSDANTKNLFFVSLARELGRLERRLEIISSSHGAAAAQQGAARYPWLWRFVPWRTVGQDGNATQHAKLWLLHWVRAAHDETGELEAGDAADNECLEVVVSSANLTGSAWRDQVQAVWRTRCSLQKRESVARLVEWGIVPDFLRALYRSSGNPEGEAPFLELLKRASPPEGVRFLASIPGLHNQAELKRLPVGRAGLRDAEPEGRGRVKGRIFVPTVGTWDQKAVEHFASSFGGEGSSLELVWPEKGHPFVEGIRPPWSLPSATRDNCADLITFRTLPRPAKQAELTEWEKRTRTRWSHAKLYHFQRGTSTRLLLTSANWSPSAWGRVHDDGLRIENFEFGVLLRQQAWPFDDLEAFDDPSEIPTTDSELVVDAPGLWLEAVWDGRRVAVRASTKEDASSLHGRVVTAGQAHLELSPFAREEGGANRYRATAMADNPQDPPLHAEVTQGERTYVVPVLDIRPDRGLQAELMPEVNGADFQQLLDSLLLEEYGGRLAEDTAPPDDAVPGGDGEESLEADGQVHESYAVAAMVRGRECAAVVDRWRSRLEHARQEGLPGEHTRLLADAVALCAVFSRCEARAREAQRHDLGARLAREELTVLLNEFGGRS